MALKPARKASSPVVRYSWFSRLACSAQSRASDFKRSRLNALRAGVVGIGEVGDPILVSQTKRMAVERSRIRQGLLGQARQGHQPRVVTRAGQQQGIPVRNHRDQVAVHRMAVDQIREDQQPRGVVMVAPGEARTPGREFASGAG